MTEQQCHLVSGGYQEPSHDLPNQYHCTIVNQIYIEIVSL